ncbi:hypothetical protein EON81_19545, partial [bacterium]
LDATNVIQPAACAIVSIGLDHVRILGETLGEIAWEKAGILKAGVPCVVGEVAPEAMDAIQAVAQRVGAPLLPIDEGFEGTLSPSLGGRWQAHNAALAATCALAAGAADMEAIQRGVARAAAPGRFQIEMVNGRTVVLDGAHNAPAAAALSETLTEQFPNRKTRLVTNMLDGHEPLAFYRELPQPRVAYIAPIDFFRGVSPAETAVRLRELGWEVRPVESASAALRMAIDEASEEDIVLVTGSNYLVGEAIAAIRAGMST